MFPAFTIYWFALGPSLGSAWCVDLPEVLGTGKSEQTHKKGVFAELSGVFAEPSTEVFR